MDGGRHHPEFYQKASWAVMTAGIANVYLYIPNLTHISSMASGQKSKFKMAAVLNFIKSGIY